ncbi:3-deoxy-7-phosphoheptulonate synthase [Verrucomicrobiota bacterium]
MFHVTDDLRIAQLKPLVPPAILMETLPLSGEASETVSDARQAISDSLNGKSDRLVVIVGPCSIHDEEAALEYGKRLKAVKEKFADELCIVMRVYFEKPRTTVGWKGLINDPDLDESFNINQGLHKARGLLLQLAELGVPAACEFLDTISPQFISDLVSWGAIGARTTESQIHRELASGISCPIGFKNGTDGNVQIAVDAIRAAGHSHHFLSVTKQGLAAIVATKGNPDGHIILRGGKSGPNYSAEDIAKCGEVLESAGVNRRMIVDCSHGNSNKDYKKQHAVAADIANQYRDGSEGIFGLMIESNLVEGNQQVVEGQELVYGQSITDACVGWEETVQILGELAEAVRDRRQS